MATDIKLGKSKVKIKLKVEDLPKLGLMVGDLENNANVLGNILGGVASGDILALLDVLHTLSDNGVTDEAINEMVEDATPDDVEKAYTAVSDFFEKSPLTSKNAKLINKTIKGTMEDAIKNGAVTVNKE